MDEIKNLDNDSLIEEFEKTVRYWHYDLNDSKPKFELDDLRNEVLNRMKNFN